MEVITTEVVAEMFITNQVSSSSTTVYQELIESKVNRNVLSEEVEEEMDVDPAVYGPSLWDRRQESMTEEVMRVASRGLSVPSRVGGAGSTLTGEVALKSVELCLK